jgi:hypothetical protein
MEVFEQFIEVLAKFVKVPEVVEVLKMQRLMSEWEEKYFSSLAEESNHNALHELMDYLGSRERHDFTPFIKLIDFIRCTYPEIASLIPDLEHGVRMKVELGPKKILTVQDIDYGLHVDIREYKVCIIYVLKNNNRSRYHAKLSTILKPSVHIFVFYRLSDRA